MNGHSLSGSDLNRPQTNGGHSSHRSSPIMEEFHLQNSTPTGHSNVAFDESDESNVPTAANPIGWPRPNSSDNFGTILGFLENGHLSVVNGSGRLPADMRNGTSAFPDSASNQLLLINLSNLERRNFYTDVRAELDQLHYLDEVVVQFNVPHTNYRDILRQLADEMLDKENMEEPFNEIKGKLFVDQFRKIWDYFDSIYAPTSRSNSLFFSFEDVELTNRIQAIAADSNGSFVYDESWVCAM